MTGTLRFHDTPFRLDRNAGLGYAARMQIDGGLLSADLGRTADLAREIENTGYDGLWTAEAGHDPYLPCALAASATERVIIGTNIAVAFPRSPLVHAQIAWDLQAASRGRFILGLGTQVKGHNVRRYSTPWGSPGPRLGEMVQLIRHIWDVWQNGTKPGFEGEHYQFSLMTPFFSPGPIEWPEIPIYIAGVNPYMCRLAGELCDGLQVHPFHSVEYLRQVVRPNVEKGLAKSGRPAGAVTYATSAFVIMGDDDDEIAEARALARQQMSFYASTRTYRVILETHGWGEVSDRLNARAAKGDWTGMAELITDEMLEVFAIEGRYDDIPDLVRRKYTGLLDRISFYALPGLAERDPARWRELIRACRA
jgi:probable F420-dependent oxidoreductase